MKVYDQKLTGAASSGAAQAQETQRAGRAADSRFSSAGDSGGDRVELSGALGSLSRAMTSFRAGSAGKVQALAAQYRSGSYRPDAAATSQSMVSDAVAAAAR